MALPGRSYCHPEPYSGNRYVGMSESQEESKELTASTPAPLFGLASDLDEALMSPYLTGHLEALTLQ